MRKEELRDKDHTLLFGPYTAPLCKPGDELDDAHYGRVLVAGFTEAPLSWPRPRRKGPPAPVLTGGLLDAIRQESAYAVAYWWGVSIAQVQNWRRWLEVDPHTPGTVRLLAQNAKAMPAEVREAAAARRRGQPQPAHVRAMLLDYAKQPKSEQWISQAQGWLSAARSTQRAALSDPIEESDTVSEHDMVTGKKRANKGRRVTVMVPDSAMLKTR